MNTQKNNLKLDCADIILAAYANSAPAYCVPENNIPTQFDYMQDYTTDTQVLAVSRSNNGLQEVIIAFPGSQSEKDLYHDALFRTELFQGVRVHRGFKRCIEGVLDQIKYYLCRKTKYNEYFRLVFTGHSLGGALAELCTLALAGTYSRNAVLCITFGAPRVGKSDYVNKLKYTGAQLQRLVNGFDIVPNLPPYIFGYRHSVNATFLGKRSFFQYRNYKLIHDHQMKQYREELQNAI